MWAFWRRSRGMSSVPRCWREVLWVRWCNGLTYSQFSTHWATTWRSQFQSSSCTGRTIVFYSGFFFCMYLKLEAKASALNPHHTAVCLNFNPNTFYMMLWDVWTGSVVFRRMWSVNSCRRQTLSFGFSLLRNWLSGQSFASHTVFHHYTHTNRHTHTQAVASSCRVSHQPQGLAASLQHVHLPVSEITWCVCHETQTLFQAEQAL